MPILKKKYPRIGVYICHCGQNISSVIDIPKVREYVEKLPNVVVARDIRYACSDLGQSIIARDIKDYNLDRVVVASCSPRLHETVFKNLLESSDLNPYLFEMVNIREQCSWVHLDKEKATEKAIDLIRGAVAKSLFLEPIEKTRELVKENVVVIGAGIAGITSALTLANLGVNVYLIEEKPTIGGHMALLDKTFPTLDCSLCILSPLMVEVKNHDNIKLLTNSEVIDISGYVGNFKVKVKKKPRYVAEDKCVACGLCSEKCPVTVTDTDFNFSLSKRKAIYIPFPQAIPNAYVIDAENCLKLNKNVCGICERVCENNAINFSQKEEILEIEAGAIIIATGFNLFDARKKKEYNYGKYKNVITQMEFERILAADGPTSGKIVRLDNDEKPERIAFIQCVGSRDKRFNNYCSSICCLISIKQALLIKEKHPEIEVFVFYNDIRVTGKDAEEFYVRALEAGVKFIKGLVSEISKMDDKLRIKYENIMLGKYSELDVDMVILATALEPSISSLKIAKKVHLDTSYENNFFMESHPKLRPVETNVDGIFIAGCSHFPKSIQDTVNQANNAAVKAYEILKKGEIIIEEATAFVDKEKCNSCLFCMEVCPYDSIKLDTDGKPEVVDALCKGCGCCVAACPSGAIQQRYFTDVQLSSQIRAILYSKNKEYEKWLQTEANLLGKT
ncbi:MAG TPA: CoB--CoM heterodisulfide reductase iron-sulfur subunit A family protein [Candidatus Altiarchaeales archaeon]|nr:CoB--CoM heterodisulfide reductase iron-sulfur subunit A family protein [Candidatus Altiarchaeales archaeon]